MPTGFDLTNPGSPQHVNGCQVSSNFFDTLGTGLAIGRSFSADEDRTGAMPAAVITDHLWQERFHGSAAVIGKSVRLNSVDYTITGVLPPTFRFQDEAADIYTPIGRADPVLYRDRTVHGVLCVGRLAAGVDLGQAKAEMNTLQEHIDALNPATERGQETFLIPLKQEIIGEVGGTLVLLLGAVGFVLLIACANVADLLLARCAARSREFAVRRALGASRIQIVRQMMTESVLLSIAGGMLGLIIAKLGLRAVLAAVPSHLPRTENIGINSSVVLFAIVVSMAVGVVFGLVPALKHANADPLAGIREGGRGSTGNHRRVQGALAVVQIALSFILLSGAGLLLRSVATLWAVNPGFDTQHIITFQVGLSPSLTETASAMRTAYEQLGGRIREIRGVEAAGMTALVPLGHGDNSGPFWFGSRPPASISEIPRAVYYPISPEYLRTVQIPLLRGHLLTEADDLDSEVVALVDSSMAHKYFSGRDPVGQSLTIPHWGANRGVSARIVGVVGHVEQYGIDGSGHEKPAIYFSIYQLPDVALPIFRNEITFAVRTRLSPATILPDIKNAVHGANGNEPVYNIRTMRDLVSGSMARQRFPMILLVAFAVLALLLATIGLYGVISYSVAQRIPEIGIRMALGAAKWTVLGMVIVEGLQLALGGVAIGSVAAITLTRVVESFSHLLYGVRGSDPLTLGAVSLLLIGTALLACYIPARRAARLDPMIALRHD